MHDTATRSAHATLEPTKEQLMKSLPALILAFALAACGAAKPATLPASSLTVSPATSTLSAGDPSVTFSAATDGSATVTWTLEPAGAGSLSAASGLSVQYTPPASIVAETTVTLKASLTGKPDTATATITLKPRPELFVEPVTGSDGNPGTKAQPYKTIKQALSGVASGQTIVLFAGTYDAASGETFNYEIPERVTIKANSSGVIISSATKQPGFRFKGDGELRFLTFKGFAQTLSASTGKQKLVGLTIEGQNGLSLSGSAEGTLEDCVFQTTSTAVQVSYTARLSMQGGKLAGKSTNLIVQQLAQVSLKGTAITEGTIDVNQSSSLYLENVALSNVASYAIYVRAGAPYLMVKGGTFSNSSQQANVILAEGATVNVDGATFSGVGSGISASGGSLTINNTRMYNSSGRGVLISKGASLKMRNTQIAGFSSSGAGNALYIDDTSGGIDLGTPGDPGGNTFTDNQTSLVIIPASGTVKAVGNTWRTLEQGSDAAGRYGSQLVAPTFGQAYFSGKNFYVKYGASIQF